jgi:hypothetical protein
MRTPLYIDFPNLKTSPFRETSPTTSFYNCIGFAAGETDRWWWPTGGYYWPPEAPRIETIEAFVAAFQTLGYELCENRELEPNFEKIAIYVDTNDKPRHMARQLASGRWTSKLGSDIDIEHHELIGLEGVTYGTARYFMKRPR